MALVPILAAPAPAFAAVDPIAAESDFVARINRLRAGRGLSMLTVHSELVSVGRRWAASMATADRISHNSKLASQVSADWVKLGENVGVGMTVDRLHAAFVNSPSHYRNLVDPAFNYIGVGVVVGRDGALFTAHQFMRLDGAATQPVVSRRLLPTDDTAVAELPAIVGFPARWIIVLEQLRALDEGRAA